MGFCTNYAVLVIDRPDADAALGFGEECAEITRGFSGSRRHMRIIVGSSPDFAFLLVTDDPEILTEDQALEFVMQDHFPDEEAAS